jgi:hypothetical protein
LGVLTGLIHTTVTRSSSVSLCVFSCAASSDWWQASAMRRALAVSLAAVSSTPFLSTGRSLSRRQSSLIRNKQCRGLAEDWQRRAALHFDGARLAIRASKFTECGLEHHGKRTVCDPIGQSVQPFVRLGSPCFPLLRHRQGQEPES